MTFLAVLLSGLYEPQEKSAARFCALHPAEKQQCISCDFTAYAADMNILLSYYNLMDNWQDDHDRKSKLAANTLKKRLPALREKYPRQCEALETYINELSECEKAESADIDFASGCTGKMLGEIFVCKEDEWAIALRRLGFFLGKFIYLMDAFEDREKDAKSGSYNVWLKRPELSEDDMLKILSMMMSECALAYESMPVIKNNEILRNIIYSGVWSAYALYKEKQAEKAESDTPKESEKVEKKDE